MLEATIKQTEPVTAAFLGMRGPYRQMPEGFGRLYGWVAQRDLTPVGMPSAVYFTTPDGTPEEDALWEIHAPLFGEPPESEPGEEGVGIKRIAPVTVASATHKGPYTSLEPTYQALMQWIAEQGFHVAGPPEEIYYSDPDEVAPEDYITEIRIPVQKS